MLKLLLLKMLSNQSGSKCKVRLANQFLTGSQDFETYLTLNACDLGDTQKKTGGDTSLNQVAFLPASY